MSLLWLASSYFTLFWRWPYRESLKIKELLHVNQLHDITLRSHLVDVCTFQRKLRLVTLEFKLKWMQNMHEGSFHVRWSSEMGFSSDPHQNARNFIRGKISGFWAQQSWDFLNRTCISKIMSIWNFDVFQEDWTKKFLSFCF